MEENCAKTLHISSSTYHLLAYTRYRHYQDNEDCQLILQAPIGKHFMFVVKKVDTEPLYDSIVFYDGIGTYSTTGKWVHTELHTSL
jgi:hypothetical protein